MNKAKLVKQFFTICLVGCAMAFSSFGYAEDYPSKTIHMVVPWKAGGGTDAIARSLAEAMKSNADISIIVDNISGAAGATGTIKVAKAKADGYLILLNGTAEITSGLTFTKLPFSLDDFKYIGTVYNSPTWMLSHKDSGLTSFDDFVAKAKSNPGKLTIGVGGASGAHMIMASAIKGILGLDVRIIPYSGGKDLKKALIGNQVDSGVIHAPVLLPEIKDGMINVLTTGKSLENLTYEPLHSVKTLKDYGIDVEFGVARAVMVPKSTPAEVVDKLSQIVKKSAESEEFLKFGKTFGFKPVWMSGEETSKLIYEDLERFKHIKETYIK